MALEVGDIVQNIEILERDYSILRTETERSRDVYSMRLIPELAADFARDAQVNILSGDVIDVMKKLRAFLMTFVTEISCVPSARDASGTTPKRDQEKADYLERVAAGFYMNINPDRELESNVIMGQGIDPLSIVVLECGAIDSMDPTNRFIWDAFTVDLLGCGWREHKGIPTVFGRRYKQGFMEAAKSYSGRKNGPGEGKALYRNASKPGGVEFKPMTDDYSPRLARPASGTGKGFDEIELGWYDDGDTISHVAMSRAPRFNVGPLRMGQTNASEGQVLWSGPNPFGRVSAFLIPGNKTNRVNPEDRYEPFLMELISTIAQENDVLTQIATGGRNRAAPRNYLHADPESTAEYIRMNGGKLPPPGEFEDGKIPVWMGEVKEMPASIDPALIELVTMLEQRRARFTPSSFETLQSENVLIGATAAAVLAAYDSAAQFLSPILGSDDTFRRQLIEALEASVRFYDKKYGSKYAKFGLTRGAGSYVRTKAGGAGDVLSFDVDSFDFPHTWQVSTKSRTVQQQAALEEVARARFVPLADGTKNVGIKKDLFDAMDEPDPTERLATMAKEAILESMMDAPLQLAAQERVQRFIELDSGHMVQFGQQQPGAPGATPPATTGAGSQAIGGNGTHSPLTEPVQGQSGPPVV